MAESIKERLSSVKNVALRRALQPLFEAIYADLAIVNANRIGFLYASATWDVGDLAAAADESKEVTVTGAALGDFVIVAHGVDTVDMMLTAQVTATNTVTATITNLTAGNVNLGSTTVHVLVIPKADVNAAMTAISNLTA